MLSFWERESFIQYDFVVIGAGIVGCSTAWHLRKKHPNASIAVIERGIFPSGASTKNAGFACFGSLTELVDDLQKIGKDNLLDLVKKRWEGLKKLRSTLGDSSIDYQTHGGYELIREREVPALEQMDMLNDMLKEIFEKPVFQTNPELIHQFGLHKPSLHTVVSNPFEGQIDTGKMMMAWWTLCQENGVKFYTGAEVTSIEEEKNLVKVGIKSIASEESICFSTSKIAICTNAYAQKWLPDENILPGRGMVMITEPLKNLQIKGVFHYDEGYFYFRNFKDRILIGGGRNLALEEETTTEFGINAKIKERILADLQQIILPGRSFSIDMEWSGIMGFGENKTPIIKKINEKMAVGARLGGMGVAIGTQIGDEITALLQD